MYRAEPWTLNKDIAKQLTAFERKVSTRVLGGIKVNVNWRKWYNKELMQLLWGFRYTFICQNKSAELDWSC
jgi:hypothetical protein